MSEQEMIARADLTELAKRVEAGERCDQAALLIEAFDATNWRSKPGRAGLVHNNPQWLAFDRLIRAEGFLDAAMTLVPEGWTWQITQWTDAADARVCQYNPGDIANGDATAATPSLALCAAALRARAAMGEG